MGPVPCLVIPSSHVTFWHADSPSSFVIKLLERLIVSSSGAPSRWLMCVMLFCCRYLHGTHAFYTQIVNKLMRNNDGIILISSREILRDSQTLQFWK